MVLMLLRILASPIKFCEPTPLMRLRYLWQNVTRTDPLVMYGRWWPLQWTSLVIWSRHRCGGSGSSRTAQILSGMMWMVLVGCQRRMDWSTGDTRAWIRHCQWVWIHSGCRATILEPFWLHYLEHTMNFLITNINLISLNLFFAFILARFHFCMFLALGTF